MVEAFVGHGIGREMHEDPQVPNCQRAVAATAISGSSRAGHCRGADGQHGNRGTPAGPLTQVTADGCPRPFEHTIAVTESGPYVLTAGPEEDQRFQRV